MKTRDGLRDRVARLAELLGELKERTAVVGGTAPARYDLDRREWYTEAMERSDTTAEAHEVQLACYRRMGPEGRVAAAVHMSEQALEVARAGIAHRQPELDREQIEWHLRRILWGEELAARIEASLASEAP